MGFGYAMGRKRKKQKSKKRTKAPRPSQWGFDYGCPPEAIAVSGLDLPTLLTEAGVDAVAYYKQHSPELDQSVQALTLVANNRVPLVKAFELFHEWAADSDSDAVEITFVLRNTGGYILGISPEPSRMEQRCCGYARTHQVISVSQLWCKPIDSVHPMLLSFKDQYESARIAPYILDGATYIGPRSSLSTTSSVELNEVPGLQPLLKFELTFVNEGEAAPGSIGWLASKIQSSPTAQGSNVPDRPEPSGIATRRRRSLSQHFPVTLERMRMSARAQEIVEELQREGIQPWQVEQALCNLILGAELDKQSAKTRQQVSERAIDALDSRYEPADGSAFPLFQIDRIRSQVLADGNALLAHMMARPRSDLSSLQSRLHMLGLLDGPSAVVADWGPKKEVAT